MPRRVHQLLVTMERPMDHHGARANVRLRMYQALEWQAKPPSLSMMHTHQGDSAATRVAFNLAFLVAPYPKFAATIMLVQTSAT
jgi:hypothetical protein